MTEDSVPTPASSLLAWAAGSPLFEGLDPNDRRLLLAGARVTSHPDGVLLFDKGEPATRFFLVLDGHVELVVEEKGRRDVLEVARKNAILGEAAMFLGRHPHSARVVGFARLLEVPASPFLAVIESRFDLALRMLSSMSRRLRGLVTQIAWLKQKTTAQRLGTFLLGLSPKEEGAALVRFPYDKRLAAESLGMSAESLSRAMARLAEAGVEGRAENMVAIADLATLRVYCVEGEGE